MEIETCLMSSFDPFVPLSSQPPILLKIRSVQADFQEQNLQ